MQGSSLTCSFHLQVVTVNDYLARRDSEWVGQVHRFLGLQVGLIQQGLDVRLLTGPCIATVLFVDWWCHA